MPEMQKKDSQLIIGIDLGGTNIKGALLDGDGHTLEKIRVSTEAHKGSEEVIERILQVIRELMQWGGVSADQLAGIGIGVPGQIDYRAGKVIFAPNLGWQDVSIKRALEVQTGLPVCLDNDGNAAALGEYWCGAGKGYRNIIAITIGTGIGGGIIVDGRPVRGASGSAGEIGHMIMLEKGPLCNCGQRGCLETLTAAPAILRRSREAIAAGRKTYLADYVNLDVKDVFAAAERGDLVAGEIIGQSAYYLGLAIANLINVLNPELVVIGGGVARAGDILVNPIRETALAHSLQAAARAVKIVPAQLGNDAGAVGAGALVRHELAK